MRLFVVILCLCNASATFAGMEDLSNHGSFKAIHFLRSEELREVDVIVLVPVGEVDRSGPEGGAHYLEHLVASSADAAHGAGLRHRLMNAWALPDWTIYWNRVAPEDFGSAMRAARAVFEPVTLSQEFMLTERDVVQREFDLRYRDNPTAVLWREARSHLYGAHPFGRSVMGTPESITLITPGDVLSFHTESYRAEDAYLIVHGPITAEQAVLQIERHLSDLPQRPAFARAFTALSPPPARGLELAMPDLLRDEVLMLGHAATPEGMGRSRLWFSMLLLSDILNAQLPGGLAKPLYYDDFIVTEIYATLGLLPAGGIEFAVFFKPEDGIATDLAVDQVAMVLKGLSQGGLPPDTFGALRDQAIDSVEANVQDDPRFATSIAQSSILAVKEALSVEAYAKGIARVELADVQAVLKAIVESPYRTTATAVSEALP